MRIITFQEIISFVGDFSRPLVEGSKAMDNIFMFGITENTEKRSSFFALCLSSTAPQQKKPYEVNVVINKDDNNLQCTCSCTARELEHCKHVVEFLMLLER